MPNLLAYLPASLTCGDESECNANPARTARRIVGLCAVVAVVLMGGMLVMNPH